MIGRARGRFAALRRVGPAVALREIGARLWSTRIEYELECRLTTLPPRPTARIPVQIYERDPATFDGFERELREARGVTYGQLLRRAEACRAGLVGIHAASSTDGEFLYAQWLLSPANRDRLASIAEGPWRPLSPDEVLLEYAYSFSRARGLGVMADGMGQILELAAAAGAQLAVTYVRTDNVPSLRGCARVGFAPARIAETTYRLGRASHAFRTATLSELLAWDEAVATREHGGQIKETGRQIA